ncbi:UNVERIFIED_CONTAM: hypothetical protein K2H54_052011 [Gekko kuhli]
MSGQELQSTIKGIVTKPLAGSLVGQGTAWYLPPAAVVWYTRHTWAQLGGLQRKKKSLWVPWALPDCLECSSKQVQLPRQLKTSLSRMVITWVDPSQWSPKLPVGGSHALTVSEPNHPECSSKPKQQSQLWCKLKASLSRMAIKWADPSQRSPKLPVAGWHTLTASKTTTQCCGSTGQRHWN